jgi:hypothetical protein
MRSLLLEAADAIDRANAIVCALDGDDRALLAIPLDEYRPPCISNCCRSSISATPDLPRKAKFGTAPWYEL